MCGIFGYVGQKNAAAQIVLSGLKTLEYRGYDSWGVTFPTATQSLEVEKAVGKIGDSILKSDTQAMIAIGHTRWATHGGVTYHNSHPHFDCQRKLAIVHNGIVENYRELKTALLKKGHVFSSETDSEVIAHLLEDATKELPLVAAVHLVFNMLDGLNAIVVINDSHKEIVAAKNGSPLVVGIGKGEYFISSDPAGIAPFAQEIVYIDDGQLVTLNATMHLYSMETMEELEPKVHILSWNSGHVAKGDFTHFMMKEIAEQPGTIQTIAETMRSEVTNITSTIRNASRMFLIGCGTAYHAGLAGSYLLSRIAKMDVHVSPASEFAKVEQFVTPDSLIMALTQSGETIDVVEPLNRVKARGTKVLSLVNVQGSTIYRLSDYHLLLGAGIEKAVASTKAYIAKLSLLTLIAYSLADKLDEGERLLQESAKEIKRLLTKPSLDTIQRIAIKLLNQQSMYIIGRGMSYPTAIEGALKIKEVSYIHAEGLAGGELKHGTIALIEEGTACIVLAPQDDNYEAILSNAMEIKARGGYIIGISPTNSPVFDEWIEVQSTGITLITQVVPLQILAYYLAVGKNLDPDMPRNLAKSVTVR